MAEHLETGKLGEEVAKKYLEENGYKILEQNYKTKYAEIDLIGEKNKEMVFFEVRTKRGENFGTPEDTLKNKKLRKLWMNAQSYSAFKKWQGPYRIDAVCVVFGENGAVHRINHYENII